MLRMISNLLLLVLLMAALSVPARAQVNQPPTITLTAPQSGTVLLTTRVIATPTSPQGRVEYAPISLSVAAADADGQVTKVEYFNGSTLLATSTRAPFAATWKPLAPGAYRITARATDNLGATTTSNTASVRFDSPTPTINSPFAGSVFTAPARILVQATLSPLVGTPSRVEFLAGETVIGTLTQGPYAFTWASVAAGTHDLSVRATYGSDVRRGAPVRIQVRDAAPPPPPPPQAAARLYFIHPDHLGTPRLVADATGRTVWQWDNQEPFGLSGVQDDPDGDGRRFELNLRFPGQTLDAETGLHHNQARDYDAATGRYIQSDPIGLDGGISTYLYAAGNPIGLSDPLGLAPKDPASVLPKGLGAGAGGGGWGRGGLGGGAGEACRPGDAAKSAGQAAALRSQLIGKEIAGGHAFEKHVLQQGEFKGLGIRTREQFASHIENVVNAPSSARYYKDGRTVYLQESSGTVVIRNGLSGEGTAFQPRNWSEYTSTLPSRTAPY